MFSILSVLVVTFDRRPTNFYLAEFKRDNNSTSSSDIPLSRTSI